MLFRQCTVRRRALRTCIMLKSILRESMDTHRYLQNSSFVERLPSLDNDSRQPLECTQKFVNWSRYVSTNTFAEQSPPVRLHLHFYLDPIKRRNAGH